MNRKIVIDLSSDGIKRLRDNLAEYNRSVRAKRDEACERIANIGKLEAQEKFDAAQYDGDKDVMVGAEQRGNSWFVRATGTTVLFIEFGAGRIGGGHPEEQGMTPGSYSDTVGKGQWNNPEGWIYQHDKPRSHGNVAGKCMYDTVKVLEDEARDIIREVFNE